MHRTRFVSPPKGSPLRKITLKLLRPQGLSGPEAVELRLVSSLAQFPSALAHLEYHCGFDIHQIGKIPMDTKGKPHGVYRIEGRHRWNGRYRTISHQV